MEESDKGKKIFWQKGPYVWRTYEEVYHDIESAAKGLLKLLGDKRQQNKQVIAALLALPVLVQTSADLIQAWDVWKRTTSPAGEGAQGALPGPVDFWGGSESFSWWVLRQGALMGVSVLVLAAALYLLGKSGRWAGRRGS
jgi:hypothetical protein